MMTEALANLNDNDNAGYLLLLIKRNIYWFQSFVTASSVGTAENSNGFCEQKFTWWVGKVLLGYSLFL